jgi:type I restriction-modification system DNA methylase subunit
MQLEQILALLRYTQSKNYRDIAELSSSATSHLFRAAARANVRGAYVFHTSPNDEILPVRPAVYVAEANTPDEARRIHKKIWNLGNAPFLLVLLPNQVRIYNGFDFDTQDERKGILNNIPLSPNLFGDIDEATKEKLNSFSADSVDNGEIWKANAAKFDLERRVDKRLLKTLRNLENVLVERLKNSIESPLPIIHALIGKYVYIRYLRDRDILSDKWLEDNNVKLNKVLGRNAKLSELRKLNDALETRFNGAIFPFPKGALKVLTDDIVSDVAAAFKGDDLKSKQLHLDFEAFDFSFIPVETLSAIYEQFLRSQGKDKKEGAVYTPEPLADYLMCEMNYIKPLQKGMRILDPCCGSGVFLVLAYRRLIEQELLNRPNKKLLPTELREILLNSIYGVERNKDACYVAEFSLVLTMLNYIDPPELHRNPKFKFPNLHNERIFECDFFDNESLFCKKNKRFDWVIGNPPWTEPTSDSKDEKFVLEWIKNNRKNRPVAGNRVSEACSWRAGDFVADDGCIGLILHAKSLFNHESQKYRATFFREHEVFRVSNFSNLAYILFDGRGQAPAATFVYRKAIPDNEKEPIIHYAPFAANQISSRTWQRDKQRRTWMITINEDEIKTVEPYKAEEGNSLTWKLALWGNYRDRRAISRLKNLFKSNLETLVKEKKWNMYQGVKLREVNSREEIEHIPYLDKCLDPTLMIQSECRLQVPSDVLFTIPSEMKFVRKRSGKAGLKVIKAPHLILNAKYYAYSDSDFVIPAPHTGLSCFTEDADMLRALSLFLNSTISQYYLFFESSSWGVDRSTIYAKEMKKIPLPVFSTKQIRELAKAHLELAQIESSVNDKKHFQEMLDAKVESILGVPESLRILAKDFLLIRLSLNKGKVTGNALTHPSEKDLRLYGNLLKKELDEFVGNKAIKHNVSFICSPELVVCTVELNANGQPSNVLVKRSSKKNASVLEEVKNLLHEKFSQWVYIQRGLRIFEPSRVHICKLPRLIDWTRSQALLDSDDIIAEVISTRGKPTQGTSYAALTS